MTRVAVAGGVAPGRAEKPEGSGGTAISLATQTTFDGTINYEIPWYIINETHLANIQIITWTVNLRVIVHQYGGVDAMSAGNTEAVVIGLDDICLVAVRAQETKAQDFTNSEVRALRVDLWVRDGQLISA